MIGTAAIWSQHSLPSGLATRSDDWDWPMCCTTDKKGLNRDKKGLNRDKQGLSRGPVPSADKTNKQNSFLRNPQWSSGTQSCTGCEIGGEKSELRAVTLCLTDDFLKEYTHNFHNSTCRQWHRLSMSMSADVQAAAVARNSTPPPCFMVLQY